MKHRLILWLNLSFWFLLLGGIIFDQIVAANWKSGSSEDIGHLKNFFHVANPGLYFIVKYLAFLVALASLLAFRKTAAGIRTTLLIAFLLIIADLAFTGLLFDPIIMYIYGTNTDPEIMRQKAASFFSFNFLRIFIDFLGVYFSALALHKSYTDAS